MNEVDEVIRRTIEVPESPLAASAIRIALAGGKRLRAQLLAASAAAFARGPMAESVAVGLAPVCAAVELLHASSLVHDDVIDQAAVRRGVPTINAQEGVAWAVLAGTMMSCRALAPGARLDPRASSLLVSALDAICTGQALECRDRHNWGRTRDEYFQTITAKTAALFSVATFLGANSVTADKLALQASWDFGYAYGLVFQILDDVRDLTSSIETDKPSGQDLAQGVVTLPVILALEAMDASARESLITLLSNGAFEDARGLILLHDGARSALSLADGYADLAENALDKATLRGDPAHLRSFADAAKANISQLYASC